MDATEEIESDRLDDNNSCDGEGYGDESDPLASDNEVNLSPGRPSMPGEPAGDDDDDNDEAIFGPSIDQLMTEHRPRRRKRRKRRGVGTRKSRTLNGEIPVHLASKMGAANMAYVSNNHDEAEVMLTAIIEECPRCPAPHRTLGLIYESRGDTDRALDHFMVAAEVARSDRDLWKRNAFLWRERGNVLKAIMCLTNAIKANTSPDPESLRARAQLYIGQKRYLSAADSLLKLSRINPFDVHNATQLAQCYIASNHIARAADVVSGIITSCDRQKSNCGNYAQNYDSATVGLMELSAELKLRQKRFTDANLLLVRLRGLNTSAGLNISFLQRIMTAICQHRLGSDVLATPVFQEFMASSALMEKHRFLLWQVADACFDSGHYHRAADAYSVLIEMKNEEPRVTLFLQRALCYKELNLRDLAKADLETVLEIKPKHVVASLHMQEFLPPQNERKRAKRSSSGRSSALSTRVSTKDREDAARMLSKANELFFEGNHGGYLSLVYAALDSALELRAPWRSVSFARVPKGVRLDLDEKVVKSCEEGHSESGNPDKSGTSRSSVRKRRSSRRWQASEPSLSERERLYRVGAALMRTVDQKTYVEIVERVVVSFQAVGELELAHPIARVFESLVHLRVTGDERLRRRLMHLELVTSIACGAVWRAYVQSRMMLVHEPTDVDVLYTFTLVEQLAEVETAVSNMRNISYRGLRRLITKNPGSACLALVMANVSSRGGFNVQRHTAGFYLAALRVCPDNALLCLCLAVQVLYVAMGRRILNRNEVMPHALAFLQRYQRNRLKGGLTQENQLLRRMEAEYNVARAMHQLGLVDVACNFYDRVLKYDLTCVEGAKDTGGKEVFWGDLRREAAYNLLQIYRNSEAHELASKVCGEYLTY